MNNQQPNGGLLLIAGAVAVLFALSGGRSTSTPERDKVEAIALEPATVERVRLVGVRGKADPASARRLAVLLSSAEQVIRADATAITSTDQVFRYVERAERLYIGTTDGANKLPGIGAAISDVLKSGDVFGPVNAPLDAVKRRAGCAALRAIADELKGA